MKFINDENSDVGFWKNVDYYDEWYGQFVECSKCGHWTLDDGNFCSSCGVKMINSRKD